MKVILGIDLAWGTGSERSQANETGLVAVKPSGQVIDAGWARGVDAVREWIDDLATEDTLAMVDAPLLVTNPIGTQRLCEKQVGQRYGRWKVSANSTNIGSRGLAGVELRRRLEALGWVYDDGLNGPPNGARVLSEVYPYTTLVGSPELGYETERPLYKRKPKALSASAFRPIRATACDELIGVMGNLCDVQPRLDLRSHPVTAELLDTPSPIADVPYKHREDLLDAALCAWTGLLWLSAGFDRCQVLGIGDQKGSHRATIIAPARPSQRR